MFAVVTESCPSGHGGCWPLVSFLELDLLPGAVPWARHHVTRILSEWSLGQLADSAQLIVSELVTNALIHGAGPVTVCLRAKDGSLLIEVQDARTVAPEPRTHPADAEGGRGLAIVALLSHCWGYYLKSSGKVVWAYLPKG